MDMALGVAAREHGSQSVPASARSSQRAAHRRSLCSPAVDRIQPPGPRRLRACVADVLLVGRRASARHQRELARLLARLRLGLGPSSLSEDWALLATSGVLCS